MLLNEVKHLLERISKFFDEVCKLVEFELDSSCNAFIGMVSEQVELILCRPKYVTKTKAAKDVRVGISISMIAFKKLFDL